MKKRTNSSKRLRFVFVVGGVMSGVGKGIATSSIGKLLQSRGHRVTAVKIDPYVNVDAGTMNPTEHGEVFVLDDGTECDQDMGNYERFLGVELDKRNYMTTGSIYLSVIEKERNLGYEGKFVSVVPYIPLAVLEKIELAAKKDKADVIITEIGGTVGEYENALFLEAIRMQTAKRLGDTLLVLVSHLPSQGGGGELKTKPTQHAVRDLHSVGLHPDIIIGRAIVPLDKKRKEKIAFHCSMQEREVISAPDVKNIYEVPINFEKEKITDVISEKLGLIRKKTNITKWKNIVKVVNSSKKSIRIGIVGKYFGTGDFSLGDSYISVIEAIRHASYHFKSIPVIEWLDSDNYDVKHSDYITRQKSLNEYDGIIVPGGFGIRGVEGKIQAIKYCRENKIPYLGLCYGMQMAVIEFARYVVNISGANTTEVDPNTKNPVIDIMSNQKKIIEGGVYGGSMRLGAYPTILKSGTIAFDAYGVRRISERHRHRYEVNKKYIERIVRKGLVFSGTSPDKNLMEILELPFDVHPFFVGTQFHPEFKSRPLSPHPLFLKFVNANLERRKLMR